MNDDKIEYLKRAIKRTYKRYIGERQDGEASLKDVADFFNIPIDEKRIENYSINKIDYNVPSIELIDNLTNTTYTANYTYNAELLNYCGGKVRFNSLTELSPMHKIESLYYIGDKYPIIEKMTFNNGEYSLVVEEEFPNNVGVFIQSAKKCAVRYLKQLNYKGRNVQQQLLTKIYKDKYEFGYNGEKTFEQLYTYGSNAYVKYNDMQNKYTYQELRNVIYGVNEFQKRDCKYSLRGVCFENTNTNEDIDNYFPYIMKSDNYPTLSDKNTISAMLFTGSTGEFHHSIEIYKNDHTIHIKYDVVNYNTHDVIVNQELDLVNLNVGNISNEEIQTILTTLQEQYSSDDFINLISDELTIFGKKIDIRKGVLTEETDMLSPKLFTNKSFDYISKLINANKEDYFELISKQFESATNIGLKEEKGFLKNKKDNISGQHSFNHLGVIKHEELFNDSTNGKIYDCNTVLNAGRVFSIDLQENIEEESIADLYNEHVSKKLQKKLK